MEKEAEQSVSSLVCVSQTKQPLTSMKNKFNFQSRLKAKKLNMHISVL